MSILVSSVLKKQVFQPAFSLRFLSFRGKKTISKMKALVLGVHTQKSDRLNCADIANVTETAKEFDKSCQGKLVNALKLTGPFYKTTKHRFFYNLPDLPEIKIGGVKYDSLVVVDLGDEVVKKNELEERDQKLENIRCAVADGIKALTKINGFDEVHFDSCGNAQCVAEAAMLTLFSYDELKQPSSRKPKISIQLCDYPNSENSRDGWKRGVVLGESQNLARTLMETPANLLTPENFAAKITEKLAPFGVQVIPRDLKWIKEQKMGSFLSVAKGSDENPVFLELHYQGNAANSSQCLALVGKGITFDSGGISLKPSSGMDKMRADMGGGACVSSAIFAIANLQLKINVKGFIPLCENLPSGKASKPGDVVYAMNGKSIMIDDTDAEGRLILADALCYAQTFKPLAILDVATLTGAMMIALGGAATGVFSNDNHLWDVMHKAGYNTGDRVWRMPLFNHYSRQVTNCHLADVNNIGKGGRYGGACKAAAFLKEFVSDNTKWLHLDIASVMENQDDVPYMCGGMSGRPTRTLVEFLRLVADELNEK